MSEDADFLRSLGLLPMEEKKSKTSSGANNKKIIKDKIIKPISCESILSIDFNNLFQNNENLRDYQINAKKNIYKKWTEINNIMFQMPTGTGKTVLFTSIIKDLLSLNISLKILVIAHRVELINQISETLNHKYCITHGIIQGSTEQHLNRSVQVASIQTFMSEKTQGRLNNTNFDFIIIDEAHHSVAAGYKKLWRLYPNARKLGLTATPCRLNKQSFTELFDDIIISPSISDFIEKGHLSLYDYISIRPDSTIQQEIESIDHFIGGDYADKELEKHLDKDKIRAKLWEAYTQHAKGKKGIIYAINRKHCENICTLFKNKGVNIVQIDSKTSSKDRTMYVQLFKAGEIDVIVNVDIFSEGFDCPEVEFIQLARPTKSLAKFLQQVGRGLRPTHLKEKTIILDNVGLYNRFGLPEAKRKWHYHFLGKDIPEENYSNIKKMTSRHRESDLSEDNEEMIIVRSSKKFIQDKKEAQLIKESLPIPFTQNGLKGLKDILGNIILEARYIKISQFNNGYAIFQPQNKRYGLLNSAGKIYLLANYYNIKFDKKASCYMIQETIYSYPYFLFGEKLQKFDSCEKWGKYRIFNDKYLFRENEKDIEDISHFSEDRKRVFIEKSCSIVHIDGRNESFIKYQDLSPNNWFFSLIDSSNHLNLYNQDLQFITSDYSEITSYKSCIVLKKGDLSGVFNPISLENIIPLEEGSLKVLNSYVQRINSNNLFIYRLNLDNYYEDNNYYSLAETADLVAIFSRDSDAYLRASSLTSIYEIDDHIEFINNDSTYSMFNKEGILILENYIPIKIAGQQNNNYRILQYKDYTIVKYYKSNITKRIEGNPTNARMVNEMLILSTTTNITNCILNNEIVYSNNSKCSCTFEVGVYIIRKPNVSINIYNNTGNLKLELPDMQRLVINNMLFLLKENSLSVYSLPELEVIVKSKQLLPTEVKAFKANKASQILTFVNN